MHDSFASYLPGRKGESGGKVKNYRTNSLAIREFFVTLNEVKGLNSSRSLL